MKIIVKNIARKALYIIILEIHISNVIYKHKLYYIKFSYFHEYVLHYNETFILYYLFVVVIYKNRLKLY